VERWTPDNFRFLIEQFFANKHKDIILKYSETFLDRHGREDLKIAKQHASVLSCGAEKNTTSAVYDFYNDDVNEERLHSKIRQAVIQPVPFLTLF